MLAFPDTFVSRLNFIVMEVVMLEELSVRTSDELDDATELLDSLIELLETASVDELLLWTVAAEELDLTTELFEVAPYSYAPKSGAFPV